LAEGILQAKAAAAGLDWTVDSAGTGGYHNGEAPHKLSQKVAKLNGIDISSQRGRQYIAADMDAFDRIYTMDQDNYSEVKRISGRHFKPEKTDLILNSLYPSENHSVPDPWYGTEPGYHEVFELLSNACDRIIADYLQASTYRQ
jgi:protein-tyrosine phosphatase